ncbi:aspartic peptidase domain-containing protein [Aspergillus coremiiformis]|uniref:Aspartic peptidase domain-containing protein n=1 Tax=Aspergillus coremiiformis TaxID=138285 RepID=A0A5N6YU48_9EURO|nr:aspartic peptidase domain-containing protein [Aspergillus coremiiformis]
MIKFWALAFGAAHFTNALILEKKDVPSVLEVPFVTRRVAEVYNHHDRRGKREHILKIGTGGNVFFANVSFGSPSQILTTQFSTYGDESSVMTRGNREYARLVDVGIGQDLGSYNASDSTSSRVAKGNATIVNDFTNESTVGDIITDTVTVGDVKLNGMKFITVRDKYEPHTLGLGYSEANSNFISLPQALVDAKTIQSPAFSMWKEEEKGQTEGPGVILFGGVNKAKYVDKLHTLPVISPPGIRKAFRVNFTGLSLGTDSMAKPISPDSFPTDAVFVSATPLTILPEAIARDLFSQLNTTELYRSSQPMFPCDKSPKDKWLTFHFGQAAFNISIESFIEPNTPASYPDDPDGPDSNKDGYCYLGLVGGDFKDSHGGNVILGANFLQKIYTVFDMGNDEVSIAQRRWEKAPDEILEIKSGKDSVPDRTTETADKTDTTDKPEKTDKSSGSHLGPSDGLRALMAAGAILFVALI